MARRWFQLHFVSMIALFVTVSAMLGLNVAVFLNSGLSVQQFVERATQYALLVMIEAVMVLYPVIMVEAKLRRDDDRRKLRLRFDTILFLSLGACLFLVSGPLWGGIPIDTQFMSMSQKYLMMALNLYLWIIGFSFLAYVWETIKAPTS